MYKILLDGLHIYDAPIGLDDMEFSILRDDGFSNGDQIIRYRATSTLTFIGDAYKYLCQKKKESICNIVSCKILTQCDTGYELLFSGNIPISWVEFNHTTCTAQSQIRDNSFSAFVKDFIKTEVNLWSTKTKNCLPITGIDKNIDFSKIHNSAGSAKEVLCFDVIAVLNYIIKYITDNKMSVVSNYYSTPTSVFGSNLYAITTGFNLRNVSSQGDIEAIYPTLSFEKVFKELRKKHRVFMDVVGDTIYIEPESSMYENTQIFEIDGLPNDIRESVDKTRLFNGFKIGSSNTKLQNNSNAYYQSTKLNMWGEYNLSSCGDCTTTTDSENANIDIVSEFIIDSNMIHEQLNTSDTGNDKSVYLVNYFEENGVTEAMREYIGGEWVYNTAITNQKVIDNWIGFSPQCLAAKRYFDLGFLVRKDGYGGEIKITPFSAFNICDIADFDIITDVGNNVFKPTSQIPILVNTSAFSGTASWYATYFKTPINTNINIRTDWINLHQSSGTNWVGFGFDYSIYLFHYTDDTFTTIKNTYSQLIHVNDAKNEHKDLSVETGMIPVLVGECFLVCINIEPIGGLYNGMEFYFTSDYIKMQLTDADGMCDTRNDDNFDSKANMFDFEYPICHSDFKSILANKKGYIRLNGIKAWIKELRYSNKKTTLKLVSNNSLCKC